MSILYFVPGPSLSALSADQVVALGLGYAFEGSVPAPMGIPKGPDGGEGTLIRFDPPEGVPEVPAAFEPGNQTWEARPDGKVWIGFWNDRRPRPETVLRREPLGGKAVKLEDGNEWIVPVGRPNSAITSVPLVLKRKGDGVEARPSKRFESLCADAKTLFDFCYKEAISSSEAKDGQQIAYRTAYDIACRALAVNYRIGPDEVDVLGLLSTTSVILVGRAIADWDGFLELCAEKKPEPAGGGSSTANGGTAG
jgi:hypothetical protein